MSRTKGSRNRAKVLTPEVNKVEDLQYEVAILKAAVKQLIRESRDWRIKNEKVVDILTDRVQRTLLAGYDNGGERIPTVGCGSGGDELRDSPVS